MPRATRQWPGRWRSPVRRRNAMSTIPSKDAARSEVMSDGKRLKCPCGLTVAVVRTDFAYPALIDLFTKCGRDPRGLFIHLLPGYVRQDDGVCVPNGISDQLQKRLVKVASGNVYA